MANSRIKNLPLASSMEENDFFVIDGDDNGTRKITNATILGGIETDISAMKSLIGNTALPTTAQTITGAIDEHETDIIALNAKTTDVIKTAEYTYSYSVSGNSSVTVTASQLEINPPTGYSPLAICRIASGQSVVVVRNFNAITSGNVVSLNNTSSSSVSGTVTVGFVYILSSLVSA